MLISALINTQDVLSARTFGFTEDYMEGYPSEYQWLINYVKTYGCQPSEEAFRQAFPDFRVNGHEDVRSAVDAVFRAHARRRMVTAMTEAYEALNYDDPFMAWDHLQAAKPMRTNPKPRKSLTDLEFLDNWDQPLAAVEMPYPTLQAYTKGLMPGNLWYIAARPGQGKSAHLVSIAKHAVLAGNRVRFFSLEMSEEEVRARFHAALATHFKYKGITLNSLRDRSVDRRLYKEFVGELSDRLNDSGGSLSILTPADGSVTPGTVAAGADEYHLNAVDYVQLMRSDDGAPAVDDWRTAARISNALKEHALSSTTGVLAAAQINRDGDTGTAPPKIKNLSQSDALGQDGDVVITMRAKEFDVATAFSIEKNRHGPSGIRFYTTFDPNYGVFREINAEAVEAMVIDREAAS